MSVKHLRHLLKKKYATYNKKVQFPLQKQRWELRITSGRSQRWRAITAHFTWFFATIGVNSFCWSVEHENNYVQALKNLVWIVKVMSNEVVQRSVVSRHYYQQMPFFLRHGTLKTILFSETLSKQAVKNDECHHFVE